MTIYKIEICFQLEHEDENNDGAEVTWGAYYVRPLNPWPDHASPETKLADDATEDQQRINSFSKLNTRLRSLEGKLEELKVGDQFTRFLVFINPRAAGERGPG